MFVRFPSSGHIISFCTFAGLTFVGACAFFLGKASASEQESKILVQGGVSVEAVVAAKDYRPPRNHSPGDESIDYSYTVQDRTYHGFARIGDRQWVAMNVGDRIRIYYDPARPWRSQLQPAQELRDAAAVRKITQVVLWVGISGMLVTALLWLGSFAGFVPHMGCLTNIFSLPGCIGLPFFSAGAGFSAYLLWQTIWGNGAIMAIGSTPPHVLEWWELGGILLFLSIFWVFGLVLMMLRKDTSSDSDDTLTS